jgi:hypothetical protein
MLLESANRMEMKDSYTCIHCLLAVSGPLAAIEQWKRLHPKNCTAIIRRVNGDETSGVQNTFGKGDTCE